MTISSTTRKTTPYIGDGSTTVFAFAFKVFSAADVYVAQLDTSTDVEDILALTTDYSVSLNANQNTNPGGTITLVTALAVGQELVISSNVQPLQQTDLTNSGGFYPSVITNAFDKVTILIQQILERNARSLALPITASGDIDTTVPIPSGGKYFRWNLAGTGLENADAVYDNGNFLQSGTGAVERTVDAKLGDIAVTPEDFGAVGDGSANDTTPLTRAIATGRPVVLTAGKTYKFTSNISITTSFQYVGGMGVLKPDGNCGIILTGSAIGIKVDLVFESATHTGIAIKVDTAHRSVIRAYFKDVYDGFYITSANVTTIEWAWGAIRHKPITWFGNNSQRSDVLNIEFGLFSVPAAQYGLDWDGNCHSLEINYLGLVCGSSVSSGNGYGMIVRNTSGGTAPAIARINHIEIDYCGTHAIDITTGSDIDINIPYLLGATGSGIRTGATINDYEVRVAGGKSRGNTRYGIESLGGVVLYDGSTDMSANTLGKTTGSVWTMSERFALDANAYYAIVSSNPLFVFDANDYLSYTRSTNTLGVTIGATAVLSVDATRATFNVRPKLPTSTVASLPAVHIAGDLYFATNGRKNGEGAGAGTGVLVVSDGTAWRAVDTNGTVAA